MVDRDQRFQALIDVRTCWLTDGGDQRFQDDPDDTGSANVWAFGRVLFVPARQDRFQIDVGPGVGLLRFSGKDDRATISFDAIYRFTISPCQFFVRAVRAERCLSLLRLRLDSMYVPEGFTGDQFGNNETSFKSGGEFLTRLSVVSRF